MKLHEIVLNQTLREIFQMLGQRVSLFFTPANGFGLPKIAKPTMVLR